MAYLQNTWEQGTHLLLSKRSAWQTIQLRGPSLNVWESYPKGHLGETTADSLTSFFWESYPKGHFGETVAESLASFFVLLSVSIWCLIGFSPGFLEVVSSGRAALTKGQTGVILVKHPAPKYPKKKKKPLNIDFPQ